MISAYDLNMIEAPLLALLDSIPPYILSSAWSQFEPIAYSFLAPQDFSIANDSLTPSGNLGIDGEYLYYGWWFLVVDCMFEVHLWHYNN